MGMSTHVVGIIPADEKWHVMKKIWDACKEAKISVPEEVCAFFGEDGPGTRGQVMDIRDIRDCVTEYNDSYRDGLDVDLRKLPSDIKILRFYNSY